MISRMQQYPLPDESVEAKRHKSRLFVKVLIGACSVILLLGAAWFSVRTYIPSLLEGVASAWSVATLDKELKDATFVGSGGRYTSTLLGYRTEAPISDRLVSYDEGENGEVVSIVKASNGSYQLNIGSTAAFSSIDPIRDLSLSSDGHRVGFTSSAEIATSSRELYGSHAILAPLSSYAQLYYVPSKKVVTLGPGVAPLFRDNAHVIRFSPGGIIETDLSTGNETVLLTRSFSILSGPILQSPDRSLIAFTDTVANTIFVYRFSESTLELVAKFDASFVPEALGNSGLYELRYENGRSTVWKHSFKGQEAHKAGTFPPGFRITAISL